MSDEQLRKVIEDQNDQEVPVEFRSRMTTAEREGRMRAGNEWDIHITGPDGETEHVYSGFATDAFMAVEVAKMVLNRRRIQGFFLEDKADPGSGLPT
jgi:hypothetical protein